MRIAWSKLLLEPSDCLCVEFDFVDLISVKRMLEVTVTRKQRALKGQLIAYFPVF